MGEDVQDGRSLFELPANGEISLPEFRPAPMDLVPAEVTDTVHRQDRMGTLTRQQPIGSPYSLDFGPAGLAYVLPFYEERESLVDKQNAVYAIDAARNGDIMGYAISTLKLPDKVAAAELPFVRNTFTDYLYLNLGLGLRRHIVLNEANKLLFQRPLRSNPVINPAAVGMWEKLVDNGLAIRDGQHFRFK